MPRHEKGRDVTSDTTNHQWFATTHWSALFLTGEGESQQALEAVEQLCRAYWGPLYSFVRHKGIDREDAKDLTQAFFAKVLEKNFWARADPRKGRFRSFLLTALSQFLADQRDRANAAKRGGGAPVIPIDDQIGEEQYLAGRDLALTGEQQFERQWASSVLEHARVRLQAECVVSGRAGFLDRVNLLGENIAGSPPYADLARELGMSVGGIKSAVSRLRDRYGELVREEVARTVSSPAEVDEEIRHLLSVIGS